MAASTLLLLDGDDDFRGALAQALRDDGFRVISCANEDEIPGRERLAQVDVLLSADDSPGHRVLGFIDRFHAGHPDVPAILFAAFVSMELERAAYARPFVRLLRKPVDYENLHTLLRGLAV